MTKGRGGGNVKKTTRLFNGLERGYKDFVNGFEMYQKNQLKIPQNYKRGEGPRPL